MRDILQRHTQIYVLTKNAIKYIHSLSKKKFRDKENAFLAEGPKVVTDLLPLLPCRTLYATEEYLGKVDRSLLQKVADVTVIDEQTLTKLSELCTPREALAVFEKPRQSVQPEALADYAKSELCLALDGVRDPGNMGTILRIADWFGIERVFVSNDSADVFSPKVVQATMGAVGRIHVYEVDLPAFLRSFKGQTPIYGTFLDGENLYQKELSTKGVIVMGNEGVGISSEVEKCVDQRLFIPPYPAHRATSESLNVAVATAIVCAQFRALM